MRALILRQFGSPLELADIDTPTPNEGEVLVRIRASAVNPLDLKILAGQAAHAERTLPAVPGMDMAGTVEAVGPGVTAFSPGDRVYGLTGGVGGLQGSLAEYAAVDARLLALAPERLAPRESAALPLVAITAWEGLVDRARVRAGMTVLIHGGAGGIGHVAIQIAKSFGAHVFATGSPSSLAAIEALGATPIDYTRTESRSLAAEYTDGHGFDIVFDTVGGDTLDASFAVARMSTGHVVSALGWGTHSIAPLSMRGATYSGVFTLLPMLTGRDREHHGEILRRVAALVDDGSVTPRVDPRHFTFETITDAYRAVESGTSQGKIVVDVSEV